MVRWYYTDIKKKNNTYILRSKDEILWTRQWAVSSKEGEYLEDLYLPEYNAV
jgi:hypothetical protein